MANATAPNYQRLPGTGFRRLVPGWAILLLFFVMGIFALLLQGRRVRLYLGDDHLLSVDWDGGKESYKRFRYDDIQALVMLRTKDAMILNAFAGTLTAVLFLLAAGMANEAPAMWFFVIMGSLFLAILIGNLIAGPTCKCHLRTAVQVEELVSLSRLKHAERALELLRQRIAAVQGEMTPEEIPARLQQFQQTATAARYVVDDPNAPPRMI